MENENYTGPSPPVDGGEEEHKKKEEVSSPEAREEAEQKEALVGDEEDKMALSDDPTKVKFTNSVNHGLVDGSQNGEARVDIENVRVSFAGMGKEELMKYAEDPFWIRLRWALFILFWVLWAAMLAGAIVIVITTPGCPPLPTRDWWQRGVIYQVYPKSFKDSNGDGTGDLKGIESKLGYFNELGVNTIWINPIYKSPMKDDGYDISDYTDVDPTLGTLQDFKDLVKSAKEKNLHIILDFVPNHSSDQHEWFNKSKSNDAKYKDYYIWTGNESSTAPNNWLSKFGGAAWTFDPTRKQYYLHQYDSSQPDLNLRNPSVRDELKTILKFWLDLGVDGFRADAVSHLFEDERLTSEPLSDNVNAKPGEYYSLNHIYTKSLPEVFDVLQEWRELLTTYEEDGEHRLLVAEVDEGLNKTMLYYGSKNDSLADFPFNFKLTKLNKESTATDLYNLVMSWLNSVPDGKWSNWLLGSHDFSRVASRTNSELVDGLNMITMLLSGTAITYYGEEIGMEDVSIPFAQIRDPKARNRGEDGFDKVARDFERTPMQWTNGSNAGFTNGSHTWLPLGDFSSTNVEAQQNQPDSHLSLYKKLVRLREEPSILYGERDVSVVNEEAFVLSVTKKGSPGYVVVVNFGANVTTVDLSINGCCNTFTFPEDGNLELKSRTTHLQSTFSTMSQNAKVSLRKLFLVPQEAVLIKFVPSFKSA